MTQEPSNFETQADLWIGRRHLLGKMGLAGLGFLASTSVGSAFSNHSGLGSTPKVSVSSSRQMPKTVLAYAPKFDVPEEWAAQNREANSYCRYLSTLKLKKIDPAQVIESHAKARGAVWNKLPPKKWWARMGYVLKVADRVAQEMDVSEVEVISAYRCPIYNARCSGARKGSWHQENVAVDVKFPVSASRVTKTARQLRDQGLFRGGVGGYWDFTHIDARGYNVNW